MAGWRLSAFGDLHGKPDIYEAAKCQIVRDRNFGTITASRERHAPPRKRRTSSVNTSRGVPNGSSPAHRAASASASPSSRSNRATMSSLPRAVPKPLSRGYASITVTLVSCPIQIRGPIDAVAHFDEQSLLAHHPRVMAGNAYFLELSSQWRSSIRKLPLAPKTFAFLRTRVNSSCQKLSLAFRKARFIWTHRMRGRGAGELH
jgi:hypothetical protein